MLLANLLLVPLLLTCLSPTASGIRDESQKGSSSPDSSPAPWGPALAEVAGASAAKAHQETSSSSVVAAPQFDKLRFSNMLTRMRNAVPDPRPCGEKMIMNVSVGSQIDLGSKHSEHWQVITDSKNGLKYARTISKFLSQQYGVPRGLPLVGIGDRNGEPYFDSITTVHDCLEEARNAKSMVSLRFELGLDLRGCWGELEDLAGRPVCGKRIFEDLSSKLESMSQPKKDSAGQSGSTIITNLRNHIIKSASPEEYQLMHQAMPNIHAAIQKNQRIHGGCWSTGLAPFCAALLEPMELDDKVPDKADMGLTIWLLTREIALPETYDNGDGELVYGELEKKHFGTSWFDLKGPWFSGWNDGKSEASKSVIGKAFGIKSETWTKKDAGFVKRFPNGVRLEGCGTKNVVATMLGDAQMLWHEQMTDYSFFAKLYRMNSFMHKDGQDCVCTDRTKPTFPITLKTDLGYGMTNIYWAVGVIDYIEQKVNTGAFSGLSTMKPPAEFAYHWANMFGSYFRLPSKPCFVLSREPQQDGQRNCTSPSRYFTPDEVFEEGMQVAVLVHVQSEDGRSVHWHAGSYVTLVRFADGDNSRKPPGAHVALPNGQPSPHWYPWDVLLPVQISPKTNATTLK